MPRKHIIKGMEVAGVQVPPPNERNLKVLFAPELGNTDKFTMLFSILNPEGTTGAHTHDSDEVMYVAASRGEGKVGGERSELSRDTVIFAPKLVEHSITNLEEEPLKLICFYVPPLKPTGYFEEAIKISRQHFSSLQS